MRVRRIVNLAAFVIGGVALAFVIRELGWARLERAITDTGVWFAVIAAVDLLSVGCDAFAIHGFLDRRLAYRHVFAAQASGVAINRLTPANSLGEPVKVTMLVRQVEAAEAISAIVMFNLTTYIVGITSIVLGVPLTAAMLDLPHAAALAAWIGFGVLLAAGIALVVLVRRGAVATIVNAIERASLISTARADSWRAALADVHRDPRNTRRGVAGVIASRVLNWVGTVLVLHAAGIPLAAPIVIAMLSVGILVTWFSNVIPLGMGIADGTNYALYALLGASPEAGLVFTMVNRLRTCVLAIMGLVIMAIANASDRE